MTCTYDVPSSLGNDKTDQSLRLLSIPLLVFPFSQRNEAVAAREPATSTKSQTASVEAPQPGVDFIETNELFPGPRTAHRTEE